MSNAVEELIKNLEEQIENLEDFEGLLNEQQQLILKNEVGPFQESLNRQNRLISAARDIEKKRREIVENYSREKGDNSPHPTLTDICQHDDNGYTDQLKSIKETLTNSVRKVERLKEKNEILIKKSLEIINDTMKIYYQGDDRGIPSYTSNGTNPKKSGYSRIVLNEVI